MWFPPECLTPDRCYSAQDPTTRCQCGPGNQSQLLITALWSQKRITLSSSDGPLDFGLLLNQSYNTYQVLKKQKFSVSVLFCYDPEGTGGLSLRVWAAAGSDSPFPIVKALNGKLNWIWSGCREIYLQLNNPLGWFGSLRKNDQRQEHNSFHGSGMVKLLGVSVAYAEVGGGVDCDSISSQRREGPAGRPAPQPVDADRKQVCL